MKIESSAPASRWGEAFPLGNGQIGAMVFGGVEEERIILSENTFFSGDEEGEDFQVGASDAFYQMREEIHNRKYKDAKDTAEKFIGVRNNYGTNLPVGMIHIYRDIQKKGISSYRRTLNLASATIYGKWKEDANSIETCSFISHANRVFCYEMKSENIMEELQIRFESDRKDDKIFSDSDGIWFDCHALENLHSDGKTGTRLIGNIRVLTDGKLFSDRNNQCINVRNFTRLIIYTACLSDFQTKSESRRMYGQHDLIQIVKQTMDKAVSMGYACILEEHQMEMKELYSRVYFEVDGDKEVNQIPLLFQMGRYLLYSSSREDSRLPAHLQGIWNDNVACRIGWTCDMHLDINTQMNYWPSEITALSETVMPLANWIRKDLYTKGRDAAKKSYGLDGWIAELVTNAKGYAAPYWASPLSPCPTGGVWLISQLWEHYLFTEDLEFLETICFPMLWESVEFFTNYVFLDEEGYYTCGPSVSPENSFSLDGEIFQMSNGCTYEILMIRELFCMFEKAAVILHLEHAQLVRRASEIHRKLRPYRITKDGRIAEWEEDFIEVDAQHRHTSHLLGLYPYAQITPEDTILAEAAEKTIEKKITPEEQWEDTGWARNMLLLYETRLRHPEKAWHHMKASIKKLLEPNGMIIHPPTRGAASFDNVYELDGNTGFTAAIAEMLIQSHEKVIRILPCVPKEWRRGQFAGLKARGGITAEAEWTEELVDIKLQIKHKGIYVLWCRNIKNIFETDMNDALVEFTIHF